MAGKSDIIEAIVDHVDGLTKKQAGEACDVVFDHISSVLEGGEKVSVSGFGTFVISERAERKGRNPQTGEPMTIPASKNVRFKAGKQLKDAVNG
ncbi:MAG: HU family DNA-binding protein [Acidobacteriota bacterium]